MTNIQKEAQEQYIQHAKEYEILIKKFNGKILLSECNEDEGRIYNWKNGQLRELRNGTLSQDKIDILHKYSPSLFRLEYTDDKWDELYNRLHSWVCKFKAIPSSLSEDKTERLLATWLNSQIKLIGQLTPERKQKIELINTLEREYKHSDPIYRIHTISGRCYNVLRRLEIDTLGELKDTLDRDASYHWVMITPGAGVRILDEIKEIHQFLSTVNWGD